MPGCLPGKRLVGALAPRPTAYPAGTSPTYSQPLAGVRWGVRGEAAARLRLPPLLRSEKVFYGRGAPRGPRYHMKPVARYAGPPG